MHRPRRQAQQFLKKPIILVYCRFRFLVACSELTYSFFLTGKCQRRIYQATGQSGTIESPGYPSGYSPLQTCIWRISVNTGFRVHIHFDSRFDVTRTPACRDEYVLVSTRKQRLSDFNIVRNSKDSVVFCGNQKPSNVTSPGNEMWVRFKSRNGGRKGFRAWYGAEGKFLTLCLV